MNETVEKAVCSLAVVEKKPPTQKPGGCVGIFFQLFDWNRRLAKKKLFSKKLLPPVRFKQASKKVGGDAKQPKLRLIADENSGGFPTAKNNNVNDKEQRRVPTLVARLMGLESMPVSHREKSKKVGVVSKPVDISEEKGGNKHELRPQKLQRTTVSERQPMTRFGGEKLPALPKPRKHPAKLPSPVKSPRNVSRKSSSKLIGAAARILEPGLQTSRSKYTLSYSNTLQHHPRETNMDVHLLTTQMEDPDGFKGESSCRNCGYLSDNSNAKPFMTAQPLVFASPSSNCCERKPVRSPNYHELEDFNHSTKPYAEQMLPQTRNQMLHARETSPSRPNSNSVTNNRASTTSLNVAKDSVSASLSGSTRSRAPNRMDHSKFELEKRVTNDSVSHGRKRRPSSISRHEKQFVRQQDRTFTEVAERRGKSGVFSEDSLQKENGRKMKIERACPISGDALGALLEQKLNELNRQGEDMGNAPRKSTATILQELITALTSEVPLQLDNVPAVSDQMNGWYYRTHPSNSTSSFNHSQAAAMRVEQPFESEHLSPGSVLETQISTDSFPCSSVDNTLCYKMFNESQDFSYYEPQPELYEAPAEGSKAVTEIIINVSETLRCSSLAFGLKGQKLEEAKEVLLNAELAFHRANLSGSVIGKGSPVKHLLLYDMETLARLLWMDFGCSLGVEAGTEVNQLRSFALDSTMEYLSLRFEECANYRSKVARKLPLRMNNNMLIVEIVEGVRKWEKLSRLGVDELIEREMSVSLGEWTVCESEALEMGMEMSRHLLQVLVDEVVFDVWKV